MAIVRPFEPAGVPEPSITTKGAPFGPEPCVVASSPTGAVIAGRAVCKSIVWTPEPGMAKEMLVAVWVSA